MKPRKRESVQAPRAANPEGCRHLGHEKRFRTSKIVFGVEVMDPMLVGAIAAVEGRRRRARPPRRADTGFEYRRKSGDRALNAWS